MNSTKPIRAYLSGAMEHAPDGGRTWREDMEAFLGRLGHAAYNPARDVRKNLTDEEIAHFRAGRPPIPPGSGPWSARSSITTWTSWSGTPTT